MFIRTEDTALKKQDLQKTKQLLHFIEKSPTAFHAVEAVVCELEEQGFTRLEEGGEWTLSPGEGYFVTRNQSSVIAFRLPKEEA
ncbi:MAG: hypothetical protein II326_06865, partial [Clostridia bacterium]|nr:hypothetical protein [Clostridia bacterium]